MTVLAALASFNSMKVRLKHKRKRCRERASWFQFHEGPIKAPKPKTSHNTPTKFQFHEGPIKAIPPPCLLALLSCFNSMKVRLKLRAQLDQVRRTLFQFHEGPIKATNLVAFAT